MFEIKLYQNFKHRWVLSR